MNKLILCASLLLGSSLAFSQTAARYYLRAIDWQVDGITREWALRDAADIKGDERWPDLPALEAWVANAAQLLVNQRVLESSSIEYQLGDAGADGSIPVDLVIKAVDTWNIVALPKPQYSSNTGLDFSLRIRDYNFLGTMQPLKVNLGYSLEDIFLKQSDYSKATIYGDLNIDVPFRAFDHTWNLNFDHTLAYTGDQVLQYTNKTGVGIEIPLSDTKLTVGAYQYYYYNEKNDKKYWPRLGKYFKDTWYLQNSLTASWEIPTSIVLGRFGKLYFKPEASIDYNYRPGGDIGEQRVGPSSTVSQSLYFSRLDWIGNFQDGLSMTLKNSNTFNYATFDWTNNISMTGIFHQKLNSFMGVSSKLYAEYNVFDTDTEAGVNFRGILDEALVADSLVAWSIDMPFSVISFMPYEWFGKKWMKFFQFEQHWAPFADIGYAMLRNGSSVVQSGNFISCAGLEVITFPAAFRSLFLRLSFAFDLSKFPELTEGYLGLDLQY